MPIEMKMPRLSDTMEVGTVVKWNVKPGQKVKSGDVVADIETDKATMELQTYDDGTVSSLAVPEGQSVPVGTTILLLAEPGEDASAIKPAPGAARADAAASGKPAARKSVDAGISVSEREDVGATVADREAEPRSSQGRSANGVHAPAGTEETAESPDRIFASPLARKVAEERGIDLSTVQGTGPSGRIIRRDVETAARGGSPPPPPAAAPPQRPARPGVPAEPSKLSGLSAGAVPGAAMVPSIGAELAARTIPLSNMRATIARRLVQSKATIPHYQVTVSARMDALLSLRAQLNEQLASQGVKLSVNDFIVRACALAMHQHPFVNSRWREPQGGAPSIELVPDVNIGVAIALPIDPNTLSGGGLVVATLRQADRLGLRQISSMTRALSEKARAKGLTIEEMADSTFTISNLGMFGVDDFTAIINPPNVAILAVGAAIEKPIVETDPKTGEKRVSIGHEMAMTMSSDHRVVDGAMAAQYLATVKELLERPATLLV